MTTIGENIRLKMVEKDISAYDFVNELNSRFLSFWTSIDVYNVVRHPGIQASRHSRNNFITNNYNENV
jgi:hypothetical protein